MESKAAPGPADGLPTRFSSSDSPESGPGDTVPKGKPSTNLGKLRKGKTKKNTQDADDDEDDEEVCVSEHAPLGAGHDHHDDG